MAHYFLAIKVPASLQTFYHRWQNELAKILPYKKWTAKEDLHITISFLGEVKEEQLNELINLLQSVKIEHRFQITLGGLDGFGRPDRPRVLFIDVNLSNPLNDLYQRIIRVMKEVGFERDKRAYRPHITLAKKWAAAYPLPKGVVEDLQVHYDETQLFDVTDFILYKIHPQQIPSYEPIRVFSLVK